MSISNGSSFFIIGNKISLNLGRSMVKIVIGNVYSKIVGRIPDVVNIELDRVMSYFIPSAHYAIEANKKKYGNKNPWDGSVHLYFVNGQSFYTGLLSLVRDVFDTYKVQYEKVDRRSMPQQNFPELTFTAPPKFEDRDYQNFTIDRSLKFTRGILEVCTGGGKTMIVTRLIEKIKTYPFVFYVLTKDLMEQAYENLSSCLNCPIGRIGDGRVDIQKITVCTIQTAIRALHKNDTKFKINDYVFDTDDKWNEKSLKDANNTDKIKRLIGMAKGIYFDECHHAAAKTVKEVLAASENAFWRYGGSATPYREDNADLVIQAMFGGKIVDIKASYLIKRGYLLPPHIFIEPIDSNHGYKSWKKIYKTSIADNELLHAHVAKTANHLVERGLSVLVLVQQYSHGDYLKKIINGAKFITGRDKTKVRSQALQDLRDKKLKCLIATSLADEGLDVPCLDVAILAGGGASATRVNQRIGRTIRKSKLLDARDKSVVIIYDHYKTKYLQEHTKKIRKILKREEEFIVKDSNGPDFILDEIDKTLGIETHRDNIFDV